MCFVSGRISVLMSGKMERTETYVLSVLVFLFMYAHVRFRVIYTSLRYAYLAYVHSRTIRFTLPSRNQKRVDLSENLPRVPLYRCGDPLLAAGNKTLRILYLSLRSGECRWERNNFDQTDKVDIWTWRRKSSIFAISKDFQAKKLIQNGKMSNWNVRNRDRQRWQRNNVGFEKSGKEKESEWEREREIER